MSFKHANQEVTENKERNKDRRKLHRHTMREMSNKHKATTYKHVNMRIKR